jgi:ribonucleoside-diphosphate reductase beta chain
MHPTMLTGPDCGRLIRLVTLLSTVDPDEVYNLAAQSHVRVSFDGPVHAGDTTGRLFFYTGFVMILWFHRQKRMTGIGEQFQYILRDETTHLDFGIDLINGIKAENRQLWTPAFQQRAVDRVREAVESKMAYAWDCLPQGILGPNSDMFRDYVQHIAARRLERIGLPAQYGSGNPFPRVTETIDFGKEKNFFETRATEYQSAGPSYWD